MTKLKWKVKHETKFNAETDFLKTILLDNGVPEDQITGFLRPTAKHLNNPFLMKNMDKAIELVHRHLEEGSRIYLKADCDFDGMGSSSLMIQFLRAIKPDVMIDYVPSMDKKHGLTYLDLANHTKDEYGLFIVPDASLTAQDAKMIKDNFSGDILVLDHHEILTEYQDLVSRKWISKPEAEELQKTDPSRIKEDCYMNYCLAINCMDGQYPNTTLSGTGVCQKFVEAYLDTYGETENLDIELKTYFYDLVSASEISDVMDLRNLESRYYTLQGLKDIYCNNEFLNELAERQKESMPFGRNITSVGWYISPLVNAAVRFGKPEEVIDMYRAAAMETDDRDYQPRRRSKEDPIPPMETQTLQKFMARVCSNIKNRQDNEVRKMTNEVDQAIQDQHLDENSVIFVDATKILTTGTVTGLVASKLTNKYFRPICLLRSKNSSEFGGSGRNYSKSSIENLKEFLEKAGCGCMGHSQAFGLNFPKAKLDEIVAKCNYLMPLDQMSTVYECSYEIPADQLRREYVQAVAENYKVFCSTVPNPMFAITGLEIPAAQIQAIGETSTTIKFTYKGINFIKKFCHPSEYDNITKKDRYICGINNKKVRLNLICEFQLSKGENIPVPEVKILAFESEEVGKVFDQPIITKRTLQQELEEIESSLMNKKLKQKSDLEDDGFAW